VERKEENGSKDHRKRPPSASFLERQRVTEAADESLWSGDGRSSQEKEPGSGGWTPGRWRRPGLGRTSGLRQTAKPDGMLFVWRRRQGVLRMGDGDGRHGGSAAGELLLSSPLPPWLSRSGESPRLVTARARQEERLGGADCGEVTEAGAAAAACFLRRRGMIPANQERFLRSLAPASC
jgi:hypothetical protein